MLDIAPSPASQQHNDRRHPLRPLAHRLPAYRRRAHRAVQLALSPPSRRQFLLRIEDTDRARSTQAAIDAIIDGLHGSASTGTARSCIQFARAPRHAEVARQLLAEGKAYYCYCHAAGARGDARGAARRGPPVRYDGRWRDRDPAEAPPGVTPVIRLKAPQSGETVVARPGAGRGHGRQRAARRHGPAARRRHADLYALGRRRRSRHGHHPCHPRRRPSDQRLPPDPALRRHGLGRCRSSPMFR